MIRAIDGTNLSAVHIHFKNNSRNKDLYATEPKKDECVKKINKNMKLPVAIGILATVLTVLAMYIKKVNSRANIEALKNEMNKYAKDVEYRKNILKDLNIREEEYYKLRSVIGTEELNAKMDVLSKDIENFLPGKKEFRADNEAIFPNKENTATGKFAVNLHVHTKYSDGKFTISELLNQAAKYGNERVRKLGKDNPFYLAITDHDTIQGCKEAIQIILAKPNKYKNLRLVLGIENTTISDYPSVLDGAVQTHLISYGINPFNKELNAHFNKYIINNKENISRALDSANKILSSTYTKYDNLYSYEEFTTMIPSVMYGLKSANLYIKDYMQFKLIYSKCVEGNKVLSDFLKSKNINLDFIKPIDSIERHPDYSNGQKYYAYYFKAIKSYIKSKTKQHKFVDEQLSKIPNKLSEILNKFEYAAYNKSSSIYVPAINFPDFKTVVKFFSTQKDGIMGIAHPGIVFPFKNLKSEEETVRFYEMLYHDFKEIGKDKAVYAEDNYAAYFKKNESVTAKLAKLSEKYGLKKAGGLDTHINDIFASK